MGDSIAPIKISYENIVEGIHTSSLSDLGLTESWTGSVCEISGRIDKNLAAQTVESYILVQDDEGYYGKTELKFEIIDRPFSFAWDSSSGEMDQSVKAGETLVPIVFNYESIAAWGVSGLPDGLTGEREDDEHAIIITGTVDETVASGDYKYKVTVKDKNSEEHTLSGTISVEGLLKVTKISVVKNEKQKVAPGDSIKPIVLQFANVAVSEGLENFKFEQNLPASFSISVKKDSLTIKGTVAESAKDGAYSIRVIAKGEKNNDTAFVTVEVAHKSVETSSSSEATSSSSAKSGKSSSSKKSDRIVTEVMNGAKFGYVNNVLTVELPMSSMVRVQVFDLMGHLVESFVEPVMGSRNFSLSHLSSGNYLVRVESNAQVRTVKISMK